MALTLAVAKNTVGIHSRVTVEIDLRDPNGRRPTGAFWTNPLTLYLCYPPNTLRDSTAAAFQQYEGLIEGIAPFTQSGYFGEAFPTVPDTQIVIRNLPVSGQVENSLYTFASGTPSHSPEATGPERRLSELFQFYAVSGAAVRVNLIFYGTASTDESAFDYVNQNLFTGKVAEMESTPEFITLDVTFNTSVQDHIVGGRALSDSPDKSERRSYAPIIYGDYNTPWSGAGDYHTNGFDPVTCVLAGLVRPQLTQAVPHDKDSVGPYYIFNDALGVNTGWEDQNRYTDATPDSIWFFDDSQDIMSKVDEVTTGATTGSAIFENRLIATRETMQRFRANRYLNALAYVPCGSVYDESSAGILTNPENAFDGDPFTYAELPIDSTSNWVEFRINKVSPLGSVILEENTIRALVFTLEGAAGAATEVRFGIYRTTTTDPWYIGTDAVGTPRAVYGVITPSGGNILQDERDQNTNTDNIRLQDYVRGTGTASDVFREPLMNWEWRYTIGGSSGEEADLVVRMHVETAGGASETLKIAAVGILVHHSTIDQRAKFKRFIK